MLPSIHEPNDRVHQLWKLTNGSFTKLFMHPHHSTHTYMHTSKLTQGFQCRIKHADLSSYKTLTKVCFSA